MRTKRVSVLISTLLCTAFLLSLTANAAYFETFTTVVEIPDAEFCTAAQGFDVGTTYAYSIKITSDESTAIIYRTKLSDGSTELMTNGDDELDYCEYLGHANDLALTTINGVSFMFIVTMQEGDMSLVKLKLDGTTYTKVGNYTISYSGKDRSMSGVKITGKDSENITLLLRTGRAYYWGSLPLEANSGTVNLKAGFTISTADALVNGKIVDNISAYNNQGFGYYNNTVYHPVTKGNESIILVYRNITSASGTINADDKLSFRMQPEDYGYFEIESCGFSPDGRLWFNTNMIDSTAVARDGVHYVNRYSAWSAVTTAGKTVTATPSTSKVIINGKETSFEAYNINGSNYYKLRDVAMAIKDSEKQFDIAWDESKKAIDLNFEQGYKPIGGELKISENPEAKIAKSAASSIIINGFEVKVNSYNVGGNNYFMLRDLGKAANFNIKWDSDKKQFTINTCSGYSD